MISSLNDIINQLYKNKVLYNLEEIYHNPLRMVLTILDLIIVVFLLYKVFKVLKNTRAWQLLKGIIILVLATLVSGWLKLNLLNYILSSVMIYGVVILIVVFQPELRRGLEQLRNW